MNVIQKSEAIKNGLRKGLQDGFFEQPPPVGSQCKDGGAVQLYQIAEATRHMTYICFQQILVGRISAFSLRELRDLGAEVCSEWGICG